MRQHDAQCPGARPFRKAQSMVAIVADHPIDSGFCSDLERVEPCIADHFLARRQNQLQIRRVDNVDFHAPFVDFAHLRHERQIAGHGDTVKVDAGHVDRLVAAPAENADAAALPVFDPNSFGEEILPWQWRARQSYRQRKIAGGVASGDKQILGPCVRQSDAQLRTAGYGAGLDREWLWALPALFGDLDHPAPARAARPGTYFDLTSCKAEHAHAGRIFAVGNRIIPA